MSGETAHVVSYAACQALHIRGSRLWSECRQERNPVHEARLIVRNKDVSKFGKPSCGSDLVVVDVFSVSPSSWHRKHRRPSTDCTRYRAHACVGNHRRGLCEKRRELLGIQCSGESKILRCVSPRANLRVHVLVQMPRSNGMINRTNQAIERVLRPNGDEDHITSPA